MNKPGQPNFKCPDKACGSCGNLFAVKDENNCDTCECAPAAFSCGAMTCPLCPEGRIPVELKKQGNCTVCPGCKSKPICPKLNVETCGKCPKRKRTRIVVLNSLGCPVCGQCRDCSKMRCNVKCNKNEIRQAAPPTQRNECRCDVCVPRPTTNKNPTG